MRTWLLPPLFGLALLLLIPVVVVFTPPVRGTWDPARRADATQDGAARRDATGPVGRAHAGGGAPPEFIGSIVTRTALEEAVRRIPGRSDGRERQWNYAVAGQEWTRRSPLEMTATDARSCEAGPDRETCLATRIAFAHARVVRADERIAEVAVTWTAGRALAGAALVVLARDPDMVWRVRDVIDAGTTTTAH